MKEHIRAKEILEVTTNIVVLLLSLLVVGSFASKFFTTDQPLRPQLGLQRGSGLVQLPGHSYGDSPRNLLIVLSTTCGYCSESVPFYNEVLKTQSSIDKDVRAYAIFPNTSAEVQDFVQEKQLSTEVVTGVDLKLLKVSATPTVILTDERGKIIDFWIGKLSEQDEQRIIQAISS